MDVLNPATPSIALWVPTQSLPLSDMISPVATNKATALFAEHMQIEQGLTLARNQKPHTKLPLPPTALPAHVTPTDNACDALMATWTKAATLSRTESMRFKFGKEHTNEW
jgi:hypothetical protein